MVRVFVAGWIGSTNLGDELVLWSILRKLVDRNATVSVASTDPEATRRIHGIHAIDHRRLDLVDAAIRGADAVVFGGGGLLQDETSRFNLPYHLSRVAMARGHGVPVAMVGIGAGPLATPSGRIMVRRAFRGTVLGASRDRDSGDVLAEIGLPRPQLAADPVLSLRSPEVEPIDRVSVCLRPWHGGGVLPVGGSWRKGLRDEEFPAAMARSLDEVAHRSGLPIHLVAFQSDRDDAIHRLVADRMRTDVTTATPDLAGVLAEVGASRAVVSMRYHGAVAATLGHRPSVLVGYAQKVRSLAADVGPGCRVLGWSAEDVAALPDAFDDVFEHGDEVEAALRRLRVRELGNDDAIDRLLEASAAR